MRNKILKRESKDATQHLCKRGDLVLWSKNYICNDYGKRLIDVMRKKKKKKKRERER